MTSGTMHSLLPYKKESQCCCLTFISIGSDGVVSFNLSSMCCVDRRGFPTLARNLPMWMNEGLKLNIQMGLQLGETGSPQSSELRALYFVKHDNELNGLVYRKV
jgi:hypothetical protein